MKNWKTTVSGLLAILISVAGAAKAMIAGVPVDYTSLIAAITAGIGLIVAKDSNVTGGTVTQ